MQKHLRRVIHRMDNVHQLEVAYCSGESVPLVVQSSTISASKTLAGYLFVNSSLFPKHFPSFGNSSVGFNSNNFHICW